MLEGMAGAAEGDGVLMSRTDMMTCMVVFSRAGKGLRSD